ncbi:hypothetical protein SDC9_161206 [bioreactor metagenome]|uniref:Uncharacterized protein n=1 Tax=bioreactor metagenome TaxID=1076179 RepID=A0A645FIU2_9ZZZZ
MAVVKNPRSLSTYINAFKSVDYVNSKTMQGLIQGSMRLYVASPLRSPQEVKEWLAETQDVTYPYDLRVIKLTFGLTFNINMFSILGIIIAILVFRKM